MLREKRRRGSFLALESKDTQKALIATHTKTVENDSSIIDHCRCIQGEY